MEKKYDVLIVGGGFAGAAAAIAAARYGKSVLLIEKYNCLGGAAVFNLVNPFMQYSTKNMSDNSTVVLSQGVFGEVVARLEKAGGFRSGDKHCFNEEILKYVLQQMALESGVHLLFQTYVTKVSKNGNRIGSVAVSSVSGEEELFADYFIDATGDANLIYLAGYPYNLGREGDHLCQPMTLCFRLGNVKGKNSMGFISRVNKLYKEYQKQGKIKNPREDVLVFRTVTDNIYHFNTTRVVKLNPTNVYDVTQAEIRAREQIFEMYDFLRTNFEEFKDSVLLSSGLQIGVRESRMVVGEHTLTKEELIGCVRFADSIAVCNYDIDIHSPDGSGTDHYYFKPGKYYTIPYRCLLPKGAENVLVAGRCISATHEAQASVRIMPTCCTLGEAAGVAAALAHDDRRSLQNMDVSKLQKILVQNGAKIY